ncbi:hypothetical protein V8F20_006358 [Naviculisporaceae sp. PSN 640]
MSDSSGSPRQNACRACTKAKRACDRRFPRCGRCTDRMIECQYFGRLKGNPWTHGYKPVPLAPRAERDDYTSTEITCIRGEVTEVTPHFHVSDTAEGLDAPSLRGPYDLTGFPPGTQVNPLVPDRPEMSFHLSQIPQSIFVPSPHYKQHGLSPFILSRQDWFLHPESWEVKHTYTASPPDPHTVFKSFVNTVKGWLHDFSTMGHNIFIHQQLYHSSSSRVPLCIQDAWLTLTAYLTKTEQTEDMILQILDNRLTGLLSSQQASTTLDVQTHLARTHALLIYTLIRLLFHNPPIQRTQAVDALPVLSTWCQQLREAAINEVPNLFQADFSASYASPIPNGEIMEETALWRAFIISESIRRTWMLVSATLRIFQPWSAANTDQDCLDLSTVTQNRCLGFLSFTIRAGLWEAKSASEWANLHSSHAGTQLAHSSGGHDNGRDKGPGLAVEARRPDIPTDGQLWESCGKTVITTFIQDTVGPCISLTPVFLESVGIVDKVLEETRPEDVDEWTNEIFRMGLAREKIDAWMRKGISRVFAG